MLGAAVARAEPVTLWCDGEMERVSYSASDKTSHEMTVVVDWQTETAKIDGFDVKLIALAGDNDFVIMGHAGSVDGPKFGIDLGQLNRLTGKLSADYKLEAGYFKFEGVCRKRLF
jgi:hypothetical protein